MPQIADYDVTPPAAFHADNASPMRPLPLLQSVFAETALPEIEPPLITWSREIASGETLDAVLANAGIAAPARAEIALALGAEYDLRRLRPGHEITVISKVDGNPSRVELAVDDGVRIETVFGQELVTRVLEPDPEMVTFAGEAVIESSVFAALDKAGIPARFAVDMAQMLGGTVDFRRELSGGETMRLLWREARDGNKRIGQPELAFAALDIDGSVYEIVWPNDGSGQATIYVDGEVLRVFAQPVEGARLSSVFGRRTQPGLWECAHAHRRRLCCGPRYAGKSNGARTRELHRTSWWIWPGGGDSAWIRHPDTIRTSQRGAGHTRTRAARFGRRYDRAGRCDGYRDRPQPTLRSAGGGSPDRPSL